MGNNKLLRLSEVGEYLGVCSKTVRNCIINGELKGIRTPGGHLRVFENDLLNFMKERGLETPESSLSE